MAEQLLVDDIERIRMVGSAYRKTGKRVVLVPLGRDIHAGHLALVQAARRVRGGVVVVAVEPDTDIAALKDVDVVWRYGAQSQRTRILAPDRGMEDVSAELTRIVALTCALGPSDVVMGEKDYELLVATQQAFTDLNLSLIHI